MENLPHWVTAAVPHAMPEHYGDGGSVLASQAAYAKQEEDNWQRRHDTMYDWWLYVKILIRMLLFGCWRIQTNFKTGLYLMWREISKRARHADGGTEAHENLVTALSMISDFLILYSEGFWTGLGFGTLSIIINFMQIKYFVQLSNPKQDWKLGHWSYILLCLSLYCLCLDFFSSSHHDKPMIERIINI